MVSKRIGMGVLSIAAIAALMLTTNILDVNAQTAVAEAMTGPDHIVTAANPNEVTLVGRVIDFHCFMTGKPHSADTAKCAADCIRAGVPVGLETSEGLIVLGNGMTGPAKVLQPFAHQRVEVRGKLFEEGGVRYLDIASVRAADLNSE